MAFSAETTQNLSGVKLLQSSAVYLLLKMDQSTTSPAPPTMPQAQPTLIHMPSSLQDTTPGLIQQAPVLPMETTILSTSVQMDTEAVLPAPSMMAQAPQTASTMVPQSTNETSQPMKQRLQDLVNEVDPDEQLDEDVEEVLLEIADEFIENVVSSACAIAKHRNSTSLEVDDVKLYLERKYKIWVPGFGENKHIRKPFTSEAHKERMALIGDKSKTQKS